MSNSIPKAVKTIFDVTEKPEFYIIEFTANTYPHPGTGRECFDLPTGIVLDTLRTKVDLNNFPPGPLRDAIPRNMVDSPRMRCLRNAASLLFTQTYLDEIPEHYQVDRIGVDHVAVAITIPYV